MAGGRRGRGGAARGPEGTVARAHSPAECSAGVRGAWEGGRENQQGYAGILSSVCKSE